MRRRGPGIVLLAALAWASSVPSVAAQDTVPRDSTLRSTLDGVYTTNQAGSGEQTYAFMCQGCHTAASHNGPAFQSTWRGRTLWQLYRYLRTEMPATAPGSLSRGEYIQVMAYLLKLNGMPAGTKPLAPDSALLAAITFRTSSEDPDRTPSRRREW